MHTETVTCDGCGSDLTVRTNIEDYRLVLASESKPGYGAGAYTCMGKYPAVSRPHHFCGLTCLDRWRDHERAFDREMKKRSEDWRLERGTQHTNGMGGTFWSYPCPPDDLQQTWRSESRSIADAEFPLDI